MPLYLTGMQQFVTGGTDWATSNLWAMLVEGYAFSNLSVFVADVAAQELVTAGYSRQALAGRVLTPDAGTNQLYMTSNPSVWTPLGPSGPISGAIVFRFVTNDADSPLLTYIPFPGADAATGGSYTITWSVTGVILVSTA